MKTARRPFDSIHSRVLARIRARGRGHVYVPADFLALNGASRGSVDVALSRLAKEKALRRIGRGVYDYPKQHPRFGLRTPSPDIVAAAVARSTNETLVVSDAVAANLLGLSTQVPAQAEYLTDGTSRVLHFDFGDGRGYAIRFKRTSPSRMIGANSKAGLALRALRFFGGEGVDDPALRRLRTVLEDQDIRHLRSLRPRVGAWMSSVIDGHTDSDSNAPADPILTTPVA